MYIPLSPSLPLSLGSGGGSEEVCRGLLQEAPLHYSSPTKDYLPFLSRRICLYYSSTTKDFFTIPFSKDLSLLFQSDKGFLYHSFLEGFLYYSSPTKDFFTSPFSKDFFTIPVRQRISLPFLSRRISLLLRSDKGLFTIPFSKDLFTIPVRQRISLPFLYQRISLLFQSDKGFLYHSFLEGILYYSSPTKDFCSIPFSKDLFTTPIRQRIYHLRCRGLLQEAALQRQPLLERRAVGLEPHWGKDMLCYAILY